MEKEDSSVKGPVGLSFGVKGSICLSWELASVLQVGFLGIRDWNLWGGVCGLTFHLSTVPSSQGFSVLCVLGIL